MELLSSHCRAIGSHLTSRGESCGVSQIAAGSFGFLSSCDGELREPQGTSIVASGKSGLHSCCEGHLRILLELL